MYISSIYVSSNNLFYVTLWIKKLPEHLAKILLFIFPIYIEKRNDFHVYYTIVSPSVCGISPPPPLEGTNGESNQLSGE